MVKRSPSILETGANFHRVVIALSRGMKLLKGVINTNLLSKLDQYGVVAS